MGKGFKIADSDLHLVRALIESGVLAKIRLARIAEIRGGFPRVVGLVDCSDCDQRKRWRRHLELRMKELNRKSRIHPFTLHGGALNIPDACQVNVDGENGRVMMRNIVESPDVKKNIGLILVTTHAPCGKAAAAQISMPELLQHTFLAEDRVVAELPQLDPKIQTMPCVHINFGPWIAGNEKYGMKTYELSRNRWFEWYAGGSSKSLIQTHYNEQVYERVDALQALLSRN